MRNTALIAIFLSPLAVTAQSHTLTIDDLIGPLGASAYGRGREYVETPDHKYLLAESHGNIVLHPIDGGDDKPITSQQAQRTELQLSPDGREVAYVRQGQVWVVPLGGGEAAGNLLTAARSWLSTIRRVTSSSS